MKTSSGLISRAGVVPLAPTHDTIGPMARSVRDLALLIDAMSGPDPDDESTLSAPSVRTLTGLDAGVAGLRIGLLIERDLQGVGEDILAAYRVAAAELTALGAICAE